MLCCRTSAECFVVRTMNKNTQTQIAQSLGANTGGWEMGAGRGAEDEYSSFVFADVWTPFHTKYFYILIP